MKLNILTANEFKAQGFDQWTALSMATSHEFLRDNAENKEARAWHMAHVNAFRALARNLGWKERK